MVARHDQIRDIIYRSIPGDVRARLHEALAEWVEAAGATLTNADIAFLVQHFSKPQETFTRQCKYADLAATQALQVGAFREVRALPGYLFSVMNRGSSRSAPASDGRPCAGAGSSPRRITAAATSMHRVWRSGGRCPWQAFRRPAPR